MGLTMKKLPEKHILKKMALDGQPVEVESTGLVFHPKYRYVGASPDGVVFAASAHPRFVS